MFCVIGATGISAAFSELQPPRLLPLYKYDRVIPPRSDARGLSARCDEPADFPVCRLQQLEGAIAVLVQRPDSATCGKEDCREGRHRLHRFQQRMISTCRNGSQHRRAQQHGFLGLGDRNRGIRRIRQKLSHKIALRSSAARNDHIDLDAIF